MKPLLITAIAVGVVITIVLWRRSSGPSVAMFGKIEKAMLDVQKEAVLNILPASNEGGVHGFDESAMQKQIISIADTIRFIYTVEEVPEGLLHTVSSQLLKRKSRKYHTECMLVVMLFLNRQLAEVGIKQDDVKFDISESELGTQYVGMLLTSEQHQKLLSLKREG